MGESKGFGQGGRSFQDGEGCGSQESCQEEGCERCEVYCAEVGQENREEVHEEACKEVCCEEAYKEDFKACKQEYCQEVILCIRNPYVSLRCRNITVFKVHQ